MFDFYFAGSQCSEVEMLFNTLSANVLRSFADSKKELNKWLQYKRDGWKGKLLIDSGAFSAHRRNATIDIDEYINWLNENDDYIDYAIELDEIPGKWGKVKTSQEIASAPIKSWENYLYMTTKCKSPQKILPVFHQGENFKYLETILNYKLNDQYIPYICISGNKELTNKERELWYAKCFDIIKDSKNPGIKVHCLGSATLSNVKKFAFTSMDATSWIMTGASGSILTPFGTVLISDVSKKDIKHIDNMPEEAKNKIITYCNQYGITMNDLKTNYKARMLINIHYLYECSQVVETVKQPKIRKRGLI